MAQVATDAREAAGMGFRKMTVLAGGILLLLLAVEYLSIRVANGGVFTYTLDDPYIHMALADRILQGGYGINPGEAASPSSSVIWPLLLLPFAALGGGWALHGPLIWNALAALLLLSVLASLWGGVLGASRSQADDLSRLLLLLLSLLVFNVPGLVFTGMEHTLQVALTLVLLLGLIREAGSGRPPGWLPVVLLLAPLVRYELLAPCGAALLYLLFRGHRRLALGCALALLLLLGGFSLFLISLGLPPMPSSIMAKSALYGSGLTGLLVNGLRTLDDPVGVLLLLLGLLNARWALSASRTKADRLLAGVLALSSLGHALGGAYGWYHRYEVYIWALMVMGTLYGFRSRGGALGVFSTVSNRVALLLALSVGGSAYLGVLYSTPRAARNIFDQQYQMGRLARDYLREAVAVNDLGLVAWGNPYPVLDLMGLASPRALHLRRHSPVDPAWMDELCRERGVEVAMVYERGFFPLLPSSWVRVGRFSLSDISVVCLSNTVTIYVTGSQALSRVVPAVQAWVPTLPQGVSFHWLLPETRAQN